MANQANRRVDSGTEGYPRGSYVQGNTVRSPQAVPKRQPTRRKRRRPQVSHATRRNRARALQVNKRYVVFLVFICAATLFVCVQYLQLKAVITTQTEEIARLESELSQKKADNDAFYNETLASVDLERIRDIAMNKLGMNYAREDQVVRYSTNGSSYVRQYKEVPDVK